MPVNDPKKFVAELELSAPPAALNNLLSGKGLEDATDGEEESFINNKSVMPFVANVSGQNRKDVLNSCLIAQRAADKKHPDAADVLLWYDVYIDVLTNVGWTIENKEFAEFSSTKSIFEMENAVVDILAALVGQNYIAIIQSTLGALKGLSDDDGKIKAFESNSHSFNKGNFQIALVNETNETVSMQVGAFMLETSEEIKRVLFFKGGKDESALSYYTLKCTLNDEIYSLVRNDIMEKLGDQTKSFISKLDL